MPGTILFSMKYARSFSNSISLVALVAGEGRRGGERARGGRKRAGHTVRVRQRHWSGTGCNWEQKCSRHEVCGPQLGGTMVSINDSGSWSTMGYVCILEQGQGQSSF
jgi:hypothetical protein